MNKKLIILWALLGCFVATAPVQASPSAPGTAVAYFAGGCFWCMEPPFDRLTGVISTTSGYMGGSVADPTYEQVSSGTTGHTEIVRVTYDPQEIDYASLLEVFWRNIDPLDGGGQFCDRGSQYRSEIFFTDGSQRQAARKSKKMLLDGHLQGEKIATQISRAGDFYAAEEYHQDYYQKNPLRYKFYRFRCGRDARLEEVWGSRQ